MGRSIPPALSRSLVYDKTAADDVTGAQRRYLVVIGRWEDESDNKITLQDFVYDGERFIPLWSDIEQFERDMRSSAFLEEGLKIEIGLLHDMLSGDELLVLDRGHESERRLSKANLLDL